MLLGKNNKYGEILNISSGNCELDSSRLVNIPCNKNRTIGKILFETQWRVAMLLLDKTEMRYVPRLFFILYYICLHELLMGCNPFQFEINKSIGIMYNSL